mmetsp:Transcript_18832/g.44387  ORF Transcript_18832/g.44387 Transcript_18832/m.44387 type:complete len:224 (+) Transcript_18832:147-818(+)
MLLAWPPWPALRPNPVPCPPAETCAWPAAGRGESPGPSGIYPPLSGSGDRSSVPRCCSAPPCVAKPGRMSLGTGSVAWPPGGCRCSSAPPAGCPANLCRISSGSHISGRPRGEGRRPRAVLWERYVERVRGKLPPSFDGRRPARICRHSARGVVRRFCDEPPRRFMCRAGGRTGTGQLRYLRVGEIRHGCVFARKFPRRGTGRSLKRFSADETHVARRLRSIK